MSGCVSSEGRNHQRRLRIPQTDLYSSPRFPSNTLGLPEPLWNPFVKSSPRLDTQSQAYTATYVALLIYVELARCGRCWYRSYTPVGGGRYGRSRRVHPGGGSVPLIGGRSGPPLASLPLFSWDGAAQLGTPRLVRRAVWDGLARSLGELPAILTNGVDHTLMMALSRTLVRLRNEMAVIVSRPMGDREADVLYSLSTVDSVRRLLAEEPRPSDPVGQPIRAGPLHDKAGPRGWCPVSLGRFTTPARVPSAKKQVMVLFRAVHPTWQMLRSGSRPLPSDE